MRYTTAEADVSCNISPNEIRERMGHTPTSTKYVDYARNNVNGIHDDSPILNGYTFDSPGRLCRNKELLLPDVIPEGPSLQFTEEEQQQLWTTVHDTCAFLAGDQEAGARLMSFFENTDKQQLLQGIPLGRHVQFRISPHWTAVGTPADARVGQLHLLSELPINKQLLPECPTVELPAGLQPLPLNSIPSNAMVWTDWRRGTAPAAPVAVPSSAAPTAQPPPPSTDKARLEAEIYNITNALARAPPGPTQDTLTRILAMKCNELQLLVSLGHLASGSLGPPLRNFHSVETWVIVDHHVCRPLALFLLLPPPPHPRPRHPPWAPRLHL